MNKWIFSLLVTGMLLCSNFVIAATGGADETKDIGSKMTFPIDDPAGDKAMMQKHHKHHKSQSGAKKGPNADSHQKASDDKTKNSSHNGKPNPKLVLAALDEYNESLL